MAATNWTIQAGEPFPQELSVEYQRVVVQLSATRDYWLDTDEFEVLMQVRKGKNENSELRADLAEFLTASMDGTDIQIDWAMTGADTRPLLGGYYDMLISDPGTTDARSKIVMSGKITVRPIVTAAVVTP